MINGGIVAVGVGATAPTAGLSDFVSAAVAATLGITTEASCDYASTHNGVLLAGTPNTSATGCFDVLTVSRRTGKRDHKSLRCYA